MTSLPPAINIGGIDYRITELYDFRENGEALNGRILYNDCEIRIEAEMDSQAKLATVWHEVLHAILTHTGRTEHDEELLEALAYGIVGVLRHNPALRCGDE